MMLPNGQVFGQRVSYLNHARLHKHFSQMLIWILNFQALPQISKENGIIICPKTNELFVQPKVEKVFVMQLRESSNEKDIYSIYFAHMLKNVLSVLSIFHKHCLKDNGEVNSVASGALEFVHMGSLLDITCSLIINYNQFSICSVAMHPIPIFS